MPAKNAPIWSQLHPPTHQYPWLDHDEQCEVCIIGGGLTGALCALHLAEKGVDTVLITSEQVGAGATANTMPCAEYDHGMTLRHMAKKIGLQNARTMLELGFEAVSQLEQLARGLGDGCIFARRDCLLFTDDDNELELFNREYLARRQAGLDCTYVSRSAARDVFGFDISAGMIARAAAAEIDPYLLTHMCLERAVVLGARVYENTKAVRMETGAPSTVFTNTHRRILSRQVVIASAAACADIIDGLTASRTFFMAAGRPLTHFSGWPGRCVIRSWSNPRVTCASSPDGRICVSGLATAAVDERSRLGGVVPMPVLHERRFRELELSAQYFFPELYGSGAEVVYAFRQYQTADNMPIVGRSREHPGCIFAASCGTGGMLMSELSAQLVTALCTGEEPELLELFSPDRRTLRR